jgi:pilus assembly protein Flp/PilA
MLTTWMQYLQARLSSDEKGAAAVEYALLVSLIAVAIIAAVLALGGHLSDIFKDVTSKI